MASRLTLWHKAGRFFSGLVIAVFFLPFFGVSCQGIDVISVSGADMVAGCRPGGLAAEVAEQGNHRSAEFRNVSVGHVPHEPHAIVAFVLAVVVFATAWVRTRPALVAACVMSFSGFMALGGLWFEVSSKLNAEITQATSKDKTAPRIVRNIEKNIAHDVEAGSRFGLWLTAFGLLGIGALTFLALRERIPGDSIGADASPPR